MIKRSLLNILVCPENQTPLMLADNALLTRLNQAVSAGQLKNQCGQVVSNPLSEGLVREDRTLLYPVIDGIPVMLVDEAISLEQING